MEGWRVEAAGACGAGEAFPPEGRVLGRDTRDRPDFIGSSGRDGGRDKAVTWCMSDSFRGFP